MEAKLQPKTQVVRMVSELSEMKEMLSKFVVGQDDVLQQIINSLSRCMAGMADKERPLLNLLFLGPTGVGKTETVRVLAEVLFGHRRAFTRINCQEYSAHYNVSKLLGSPPGYVGGEIRPLLSQENLDKHHKKARDNNKGLISNVDSNFAKAFPVESEKSLSIILFDEIEKGHPKLWNTLLGIMEDGTVTLGNNETVDFTNAIIVCTSNVGSKAIAAQLSGVTMGFDIGQEIGSLRKDIGRKALSEAKRVFPAEWLNRMDEIVAFNVLNRQNLLDISNILVKRACGRTLACNAPFLLEFSEAAKHRLVDTLETKEWGARPLKRIVEKEIITPISHYICSGEIEEGDLVTVEVEEGQEGFVFHIVDSIVKDVLTDSIAFSDFKGATSIIGHLDSGIYEKIPSSRKERKRHKKEARRLKKQDGSLE